MKKALLNRQTTGIDPLDSKILQFGGGNFLRGFADRLIHQLNQETGFDGGIIVVKPTEKGDYTLLRKQNGLFHVWTNGRKDGLVVRESMLVSSISRVIHPYREWNLFLSTALDRNIRFIVSNTTESGIRFRNTDLFDDICPKEFPAKLTRWLYTRFNCFHGKAGTGCIVLPCELLEDNGLILKECILKYARLWNLSAKFSDWVKNENVFCNTLVDQIVPGPPKDPNDLRYESMPYHDDMVITVEPYHIWVIQGPEMVKEELPFDQTNANVIFTDDIDLYRNRKIRVLNGAHTCMVAVGHLSGLLTVGQLMEDNLVASFIEDLIRQEIVPGLSYDRQMLSKYVDEVLDRFRNPFIQHRLLTISLNSISKSVVRIIPSIQSYLEINGKLPTRLSFSFAALIWFYRGAKNEPPIPLNDDPGLIRIFESAWDMQMKGEVSMNEFVEQILSNVNIWGHDLSLIPGLSSSLAKSLNWISKTEFRECLSNLG